jgi:hypothetical protein
VAWGLSILALLVWHLPAWYKAALERSPSHSTLMIFSRIGADMTRKTSAASSNTSSDSVVAVA